MKGQYKGLGRLPLHQRPMGHRSTTWNQAYLQGVYYALCYAMGNSRNSVHYCCLHVCSVSMAFWLMSVSVCHTMVLGRHIFEAVLVLLYPFTGGLDVSAEHGVVLLALSEKYCNCLSIKTGCYNYLQNPQLSDSQNMSYLTAANLSGKEHVSAKPHETQESPRISLLLCM